MTSIQMSHQRGEPIPPNYIADHDWFKSHQQALFELYNDCCILIYQQQVIGVGNSYQAALADAERRIAPQSAPIFKVLKPPNPFLKA
jgi:hypothetical protein